MFIFAFRVYAFVNVSLVQAVQASGNLNFALNCTRPRTSSGQM